MYRRIILATFALLLSGLLARSKPTKDAVFDQIDSIVKTLSDITGLTEEHPVPYGWMNKRQLHQFVSKRIKKTLRPEEIRSDELALKMFGLVPQDFDLRKSTIDLLTEQAAAFYDYDNKKLYLLQDSPAEEETTTLAHELSHALADQHFDLGKYMDETPANDDENLAHNAVVEGQASWLMLAYDLKKAGKDPVPTPDVLKSVADSSSGSMDDFPVLKASPLYIQQSLLFPYTEGTLFFAAVYKKMGKKSFSAVFEDAPADTSQIIHPDRYFARTPPAKPATPTISTQDQDKQITDGTLGEFDIDMLLRQYDGESVAANLAPHFKGARFQIVSEGKEKKPVLEFASEWDTPEEATAFFRAYKKALKGKWKRFDVTTDKETILAGTGDNGYFVVRANNVNITAVEGLAGAGEWRRLQDSAMDKSPVQVVFRTRF